MLTTRVIFAMIRTSELLPVIVLSVTVLVSGVGHSVEAPDPRREGWETEGLSDDAAQQLALVGQLLTDGSQPITAERIGELDVLTPEFRCTPLRPRALELAFRDPAISVWRAGNRDNAPHSYHGAEGLAAALSSLVRPLERSTDRRADFKIFELEVLQPQRGPVTTKVYVTIHARLPDGQIQQNAQWHIDWTSPPTRKPQLRSVRVTSFEEVRTQTAHGKPLLDDCTASVFRNVASFQQQLVYGQAYWQRRIEAFHGILNQAQNGLALGDVNGDGLDDLYLCQPGGLPNRLFLHQPDGTLTDISAQSGTDVLDNTHSALLIDFDNDGDQDLILATAPALVLLSNDGAAHFTPLHVLTWIRDAHSLAAADYDHDGNLDVYACRYFPDNADVHALPVPVPYFDAQNGGANYLLRNHGNWQVSDATTQVGLDQNNNRFSYAVMWIDYDNDFDQDLYVANDFGRNNLYRNDRGPDGQVRFTDVADSLGMRDGAFGMSVSGGDYNRDGFEDIYVGNMFSSAGSRITRQTQFKPEAPHALRLRFQHLTRGNTLFENQQGVQFRDDSLESGVTLGRWSWASIFADLNNDGWQDLLVANGYITGEDPQHDL